MEFVIPRLPFDADALVPVISKETIDYHYGKHLQTYIDNLNKLIAGTPFENQTLETIIRTAEGPTYNNAAQTYNHIFYFDTLSPNGGGEPQGRLRSAILDKWGTIDAFKKDFSDSGISIFGSGWVWLQCDATGKLSISKASNAGCPIADSMIPLLTFDVWEHAYYIDYRNRRAEHVKEIWKLIDWRKVEQRYDF